MIKKYRFPREQYKCGRSSIGEACDVGPKCGKCTNIDNSTGEVSCTPLRTLHWWNHRIQLVVTLACLLGVCFACSQFGLRHVVAPGPLSSSHAQLLVSLKGRDQRNAIDNTNRCAACHPSTAEGILVASQDDNHALSQSKLCLKCHEQSMPDAVHGSPHDLHGKSLNELTRENAGTKTASLVQFLTGASRPSIEMKTECGQCHREHQGSMHTLQSITSQRCQACHQNKFNSFSNGHPEFQQYPYNRPKRIEFDHVKHAELHYAKKSVQFDCKTCHVQSDEIGAVGQIFRSVPFENACASCHSTPLKSSVQEGLIVLQVPSVNKEQLSKRGYDIGPWPEQSSQLNDGVIPPIMRWLIQTENGGEELLAALPKTGRIADLDLASEADCKTLLRLTSVTKELMKKMADEGQPAFRASAEKLVSLRGPEPSLQSNETRSPWLDRFASGLPPDLFRAAMVEWFPASFAKPVAKELTPVRIPTRLTSGSRVQDDDLLAPSGDDDLLSTPLKGKPALPGGGNATADQTGFKDSRAWDQIGFGGWMIDRQKMAIVYIPNGHADSWLSRWVEFEELRSRHDDQRQTGASQQYLIGTQCRQCHMLSNGFNRSPSSSREHDLIEGKFISALNLQECWQARRRPSKLTQITKFDHTPHMTLPSVSDCQSCHQMTTAGVEVAASKEGHQDFAPMQQSQCASCHRSNAAGDACTQCHNYHVGLKAWEESH